MIPPAGHDHHEVNASKESKESRRTPGRSSSSRGPPIEVEVDGPGQWQWQCPECLQRQADALVGTAIQVWWQDDAEAYRGHINAFDALSSSHCVLYDDGHWEFLRLGYEAFLLAPAGPGGTGGAGGGQSEDEDKEEKKEVKKRKKSKW